MERELMEYLFKEVYYLGEKLCLLTNKVLKRQFTVLRSYRSKDMLDELQPWFEGFDAQYDLWLSIKNNKSDIDDKVEDCLHKKIVLDFKVH